MDTFLRFSVHYTSGDYIIGIPTLVLVRDSSFVQVDPLIPLEYFEFLERDGYHTLRRVKRRIFRRSYQEAETIRIF